MTDSISQKFSIGRLILFTAPSVIMMIFIAFYLMANSILIAQNVGKNALVATNIIFPLISFILAIAIMYATGSNAIISSNMGEGNLEMARQNLSRIVIIGMLTGIFLTVLIHLFKEPIVVLLGSTPVLHDYCVEYLSAYAFTIPFIFLQIFSQYFFVTIGKPILGMISNILGGVMCLITCYLLIAKLSYGLIGSVIGLSFSFIIPGVFFVLYFLFNKKGSLYFVKPKRHKNFLLNTCTNGSSEMVTNLAIALVTVALNLIMMKMVGEDGVAAVTVIVQVQFFFNSIYIGFGAGIAPIFAYAQGNNNIKQTKNIFALSKKLVFISSILLVFCSFLLTDPIVSSFISKDNTAYKLAKIGFRIFSLGYFFAGFNIFT